MILNHRLQKLSFALPLNAITNLKTNNIKSLFFILITLLKHKKVPPSFIIKNKGTFFTLIIEPTKYAKNNYQDFDQLWLFFNTGVAHPSRLYAKNWYLSTNSLQFYYNRTSYKNHNRPTGLLLLAHYQFFKLMLTSPISSILLRH